MGAGWGGKGGGGGGQDSITNGTIAPLKIIIYIKWERQSDSLIHWCFICIEAVSLYKGVYVQNILNLSTRWFRSAEFPATAARMRTRTRTHARTPPPPPPPTHTHTLTHTWITIMYWVGGGVGERETESDREAVGIPKTIVSTNSLSLSSFFQILFFAAHRHVPRLRSRLSQLCSLAVSTATKANR